LLMFFIFGFGHQKRKNYGTTGQINCPNCNNEVAWKLEKVSHWFTLFFLPVFPYKTNYVAYVLFVIMVEKCPKRSLKIFIHSLISNAMTYCDGLPFFQKVLPFKE